MPLPDVSYGSNATFSPSSPASSPGGGDGGSMARGGSGFAPYGGLTKTAKADSTIDAPVHMLHARAAASAASAAAAAAAAASAENGAAQKFSAKLLSARPVSAEVEDIKLQQLPVSVYRSALISLHALLFFFTRVCPRARSLTPARM